MQTAFIGRIIDDMKKTIRILAIIAILLSMTSCRGGISRKEISGLETVIEHTAPFADTTQKLQFTELRLKEEDNYGRRLYKYSAYLEDGAYAYVFEDFSKNFTEFAASEVNLYVVIQARKKSCVYSYGTDSYVFVPHFSSENIEPIEDLKAKNDWNEPLKLESAECYTVGDFQPKKEVFEQKEKISAMLEQYLSREFLDCYVDILYPRSDRPVYIVREILGDGDGRMQKHILGATYLFNADQEGAVTRCVKLSETPSAWNEEIKAFRNAME